jgi:hypothetical protein
MEQVILMHDTNNGTFTNYTNVNVGINASYINSSSSFKMKLTSLPATPPLVPLSMSDKDWPGETF